MTLSEIVLYAVLLLAFVGIAAGRLPHLRMNRAGIGLAAAAIVIALGALSMAEAFSAIDLGTIALLLSMMLVVANLRLSGFFTAASSRILAAARTPRQLLALVVLASGGLSAIFLNDTICIMLTPLVTEICVRSRRDPVPYLVALAASANVGSCATIVGNPQNMLIGAQSGIPFLSFFASLAPASLIGLAVCWLVIVIVIAFPGELRRGERILYVPSPTIDGARANKPLIAKSLVASALMLFLLLVGVPPPVAALAAAALLLITSRIEPARVFAEVDFSLLVFFSGLFIITRSVEDTSAFKFVLQRSSTLVGGGLGALALFSGVTAILSNLVSNVPAVMLLKPLVPLFADHNRAWLVLALASTFAGNLTLLGSVANLIVAEGARRSGIDLRFGAFLRAGLPITLLTLGIGTTWLLAYDEMDAHYVGPLDTAIERTEVEFFFHGYSFRIVMPRLLFEFCAVAHV